MSRQVSPDSGNRKRIFSQTGEGIKFYLPPCKERNIIRKLVEEGGGTLMEKPGEKIVHLWPEGQGDLKLLKGQTAIASRYVEDCISCGKLLVQEDYIVSAKCPTPRASTLMANTSKPTAIVVDSASSSAAADSGHHSASASAASAASHKVSSSATASSDASDWRSRQRAKFTPAEDDSLVGWVLQHQSRNAWQLTFWQEAARKGVTSHSAHSMQNRYKRKIKPHWDDLAARYKRKSKRLKPKGNAQVDARAEASKSPGKSSQTLHKWTIGKSSLGKSSQSAAVVVPESPQQKKGQKRPAELSKAQQHSLKTWSTKDLWMRSKDFGPSFSLVNNNSL